ncbi:MAG TPA: selenium metabolism-associated LysR family transcriptional regulator [Candidatus Binatia bacterium]
MAKAKRELDLHKLEVFHWVAEFKSFSAAARHLSLRQPTVSAHVRELEERLGAKLFDRVGGKIAPTSLGQVLLGSAKKVLALKKETLASLDQFHGKIRGELSVGGSNIPGEYILPAKLAAFVRKFPEVKPVLRIGDSAGMVQAVLDGAVEIGFVGFKGGDSRLAFQKIWKDEMVLAVPRKHPWARLRSLDVKELARQGFISREGGSGTLRSFQRLLARKGRKSEKALRVAMELGSTAAIKEALIAGAGFSILSRHAIEREVRSGLLREVRIRGLGKLERDFYQVVHRRRALSPVSHAFIQFLKQA